MTDEHWIVQKPDSFIKERYFVCKFRTAYDEQLKDCTLIDLPEADMILLDVNEPLYAASAGKVRIRRLFSRYKIVNLVRQLSSACNPYN